jgi:hypothetical protein
MVRRPTSLAMTGADHRLDVFEVTWSRDRDLRCQDDFPTQWLLKGWCPICLTTLRRQLLQQRLRFLQIARVVALREPPINRSKHLARLPHLALGAPEACEAHCGAEFPGFRVLLTSDGESAFEIHLTFATSGSADLSAVSPAIR